MGQRIFEARAPCVPLCLAKQQSYSFPLNPKLRLCDLISVDVEFAASLSVLLLLLLLSLFSRVWLCATPQTAAHQASPSLGFSRQEHWSRLPSLLQCMKVKSESEVAQSCPTLSDLMDCSPPVSSIHEIFQARVLEWGAIAFSGYSLSMT